MKKTLFLAACGLAILFGCTKEQQSNNDPIVQGHHAYIVQDDEADTRTDFDNFSGDFAWSQGDQIAIHYTDGSYRSETVDYKTGEFSCSSTSTVYRDGYAIYPASIVNTDYSDLYVNLPSEYDIRNKLNSLYSPVPMIAVNSEEESDLFFRHLGGLLRITCNAVPAGTRQIAVSLDKNIAGPFAVSSPASKTPSISAGGGYTNTVYFIISDNGLADKTDGIVLNLPVPAGTYNRLTVSPIDAYGNWTDTFEREISLNAKREKGKKYRFALTEPVNDSMQLIIEAGDATGYQYTLPFGRYDNFPADLEIDWGDGASSTVSAGEYTITITGTRETRGALIPPLRTWNAQNDSYYGYDAMLKSIPTPILRMNTEYESGSFMNCYSLQSFCADLFTKNPQLKGLSDTFLRCHHLQAIPYGLLDCLPDLQSFSGVFHMNELWPIENNGFTIATNRLSGGIPSGLFANNPHITSFYEAFAGCDGITSIPYGLFDNNQEAQSFYGTFRGCSGITSIPESLFAYNYNVSSFAYTFAGCSGISASIPEYFFANNPNVYTFEGVFQSCTGLYGSIPSNLFAYQQNVQSFAYTFNSCSGLSGEIPAGLFSTNPNVSSFASTFGGCYGLSGEIPSTLFSNQTQVYSFGDVFNNCYGLTGSIPADIFATNPNVTDVWGAFSYCSGLSGEIPAGLFSHQTGIGSFNSVFSGCTGLSGSIPEELFATNPSANEFSNTFNNCNNLSGEIPSGLFANNPSAYYFSYCFYDCYNLKVNPSLFLPSDRFEQMTNTCYFECTFQNCGDNLTDGGTAPDLWNYSFGSGVYYPACFQGASTLSNYGDIPYEWLNW